MFSKIKHYSLFLIFAGILIQPGHLQAQEISHYTCGMHPSVHVTVENYKKGQTQCPICAMPLTAVLKQEEPVSGTPSAGMDAYVEKRVQVKMQELMLAGIETRPLSKRHLFKEIRVVGTVAYDPALAIAQDEFVSAVKSLKRIREGKIPEITERAEQLVQSSRRKLRLLGLSVAQIDALEESGEVQTNLILPEEKMWVYGDVYEYEMGWVEIGTPVRITSISLPGEEFRGTIVSMNPVVDPGTRSVRVRAEVDNPNLRLKPDMYIDMVIQSHYQGAEGEHAVLSVPKEAVLDTGMRKIVWVDQGNGRFEGRAVEVGPEAAAMTDETATAKFYPVLSGLREGERVVTKGNFLIDSQSQITGVAASAYGGALGGEEQGESQTPPQGHRH